MDPAQTLDRALDLLRAHDMTGFADLWAENGTMEFPFAPAGRVQRLDGRAAVADHVRDYPDFLDIRAIDDVVLHRTDDPEVVIGEFTATGVVTPTGAPYAMRYIGVVRVRDGEIVSYRDYWNPLAVQDLTAFGATA